MWLANAERALYDCTVTLAVFMIEVEQLLKPVSVEEPCGKNLSYDPGFLALEGLIAGKPETISDFHCARQGYRWVFAGNGRPRPGSGHGKIGSFKERSDMERWLNDWIMHYVTADANASEKVKSEYPLADAKVTVEEVAGNPGYYTSKFFLRPHFQLEGLTASLRLVTKLPSVKAGAS
jgi:EvpB/VC_A0108, tail sheath gpW/gp25-like domain